MRSLGFKIPIFKLDLFGSFIAFFSLQLLKLLLLLSSFSESDNVIISMVFLFKSEEFDLIFS